MASERVDFAPTSGRLTAVVTMALGTAAVVVAVVFPDGYPPAVGTGGVLAVVLAWACAVRPRVWLEGPWLALQGMFSTVWLPLAGIESVVVQQLLVAKVDDQKYASSGVGRSRFRAMRRPRTAREGWTPDEGADYADFVEQRILEAIRAARRDGLPNDGVRREPAWLPIVLVPAATVLFVVSL